MSDRAAFTLSRGGGGTDLRSLRSRGRSTVPSPARPALSRRSLRSRLVRRPPPPLRLPSSSPQRLKKDLAPDGPLVSPALIASRGGLAAARARCPGPSTGTFSLLSATPAAQGYRLPGDRRSPRKRWARLSAGTRDSVLWLFGRQRKNASWSSRPEPADSPAGFRGGSTSMSAPARPRDASCGPPEYRHAPCWRPGGSLASLGLDVVRSAGSLYRLTEASTPQADGHQRTACAVLGG